MKCEQLKACKGGSLVQLLFHISLVGRKWVIAMFGALVAVALLVPSLNELGYTSGSVVRLVFNAVVAVFTVGGLSGNRELFGPAVPLERQVRWSPSKCVTPCFSLASGFSSGTVTLAQTRILRYLKTEMLGWFVTPGDVFQIVASHAANERSPPDPHASSTTPIVEGKGPGCL
jgi:hypothetical protein